MTQVAGTTLPRRIPGGIPRFGVLSFPGIEQILYVSQDTTGGAGDGTIQLPFATIGAAIAAANALTPGVNNRILILVFPGIYAETLTLADDYVDVVTVGRDSVILTNAATPLTVTADEVEVWGLTVRVTGADAIADISGDASFFECRFESTSDGDTSPVTVLAAADVLFKDCQLIHGFPARPILLSAVVGNAARLNGCLVVGHLDTTHGSLEIVDSDLASAGAARGVRVGGSNVDVTIRGSRIENTAADAVLFTGEPTGDTVILSNELECPAGSFCLDASAAVTGVAIDNNVMLGGGIHANISHVKPERIVGASGMRDWYATTQEALTSCTFDDITVKLMVDEALAAALTPPSRPVQIHGQGKHRLTRAAGSPAVTLGASDDLVLQDLEVVGSLDVAGNGALLSVRDVEMTGLIDVQSGDASTFVDVIDSTVIGDVTELYALRFADADPAVTLKRSRLKGDSGDFAVYWDAGVTNDGLRIQDCAILHGSLGANNPFGRNAAQTPDYRSTHTIYNLDPMTGGIWTDLVAAAQRFDSFDVNGDY